MQFVVIGKDGDDEGALERRLAVRNAHIALSDEYKSAGHFLMGVALLDDDGKMCGSVMVVDFESRAGLDAWLAMEPYATNGVWKTIDVQECRVGPTFVPTN